MRRASSGRSGASPALALFTFGLALALAGCSGGDAAPGAPDSPTGVGPRSTGGGTAGGSASGPRLLFITNGNSDWWNAVERGMLDGGQEFGARVEMRRNDGKVQGQIQLLEQAATMPDVKGVAVSVLEAEAPGIADAMRAVQKSGKVLIAIDSDITTEAADARRAYIGTNNRKAGVEAGQAAKALRPQGGKVAVFVGTAAAANAIERREGFLEGAGDAFQVTEVFEDSGDFSRVNTNVQTAVTKYPDVGLLLGLWSYNGPRIAEEVGASKDLRRKATVVTFDLDELAVGHLEKGNIDASVCQNPYDMGYLGVKLLKAYLDDDQATIADVLPDGKTRETGVRIIVPTADSPVKGENVLTIEEMKSWLASKGLTSS